MPDIPNEDSLNSSDENNQELFERILRDFNPDTFRSEAYESWKQKYTNIPDDWTHPENGHENIIKFFMNLSAEDAKNLSQELIEAAIYYPSLEGIRKSMGVKLAVGTYAKLNIDILEYLVGMSGILLDTQIVELIIVFQIERFGLTFEELREIVLKKHEGKVQQGWMEWVEQVRKDRGSYYN